MPSKLTQFLRSFVVRASKHKLTRNASHQISGAKNLLRDISGAPYFVTLLSRAADANQNAIVFSDNVCEPPAKGSKPKIKGTKLTSEERKPVLRPEWLALVKMINQE